MDLSVDEVTASIPDSPTYREGASMWIWDDAGEWGLPRIGVEAVGANWETSRAVMLNLGFPDGRLLAFSYDEVPHPLNDDQGRPRVLGAGPVRLECLEPFVHWRGVFDGTAVVMDVKDQIAGRTPRDARDFDRAVVRLEVEAHMAAPPWVKGTQRPEGTYLVEEHRFEQLFTATGNLSVDGETKPFRGGGLRIHRKGGIRGEFKDWFGHCWQSSRFPSGRAFGFLHRQARLDGSVTYHEGWLMDRGDVLPARAIGTPWMTGTEPAGEDVSFSLRTSDGDVHIEAETFVTSFRPPSPLGDGRLKPTLQSAITRCRWDGETAFGMLERSAYL